MEHKEQPAQSAPTADATKPTAASPSPSKGTKSSGSAIIAAGKGVRGLTHETLKKLGWRDGQKGFTEIAFIKDGVEVNIKYRTFGGEKKFYQSGGEQCFYNFDDIDAALRASKALIITEGEVDCATAVQCGYFAVSVPNGAPSKEIGDKDSKQYDYLRVLHYGLCSIPSECSSYLYFHGM
jgi:hypothetical protein